ncbi:hypothetical protein H0W91_03820 [Patescibacteria group bacterium]|nr:hypothetical protein [Patescibacteria group bacterium]
MHPLTVFPELLTFELIAPFILRLAACVFIFFIAKERYNKSYKWASIVYGISGLFILLGLYTQISALIAIASIKFDYWVNRKGLTISTERKLLCAIVILILLSLLFTGPGFLALDLPL